MPDPNFRENYKKAYDRNYSRLQEKIKSRTQEVKEKQDNFPRSKPDFFKNVFVGGAVFLSIVGAYFAFGVFISSQFDKKEAAIEELAVKIAEADTRVQHYEAINGESMKQQLNDAVMYVTSAQNQYLTQNFDETFGPYAERYLGDYNNNWEKSNTPDGFEVSEDCVWKGYVNKVCDFDGEASLIFILYDGSIPVMLADVTYEMDRYGNLGVISGVRKLWLM